MNSVSVKFNREDRPEFVTELRKRVNSYFKENNISKYGNRQMKVKTLFMVLLYLLPFTFMLTGYITNIWVILGLWGLMGFGMSGIGLAVMHDANHGAYSKNRKTNERIGRILYLVGGYPANWRIQHNVLHHTYTNIHEHDEDLGNGFIRMSPNQKRMGMHKFQFIYVPFFYTIMTLYWLVSKDFQQAFRYKKKDLLKTQNLTFQSALTKITLSKIIYTLVFIVLPLAVIPIPWWYTMLGFLLMQAVCGLSLALVFQCAHVIEETSFFNTEENGGSMENNFAIHQLKSTANFAHGSRAFSWFIGGLNYQIEHHLFPNICHVHYRQISGIVKATAEEYGVPYFAHKTFAGALRSHFGMLYHLGNGSYEKKIAEAQPQKVAS
ncbi:acyl-CoA desaturase [Limibacter armeniacum]|uniref:fatty acid desaturase family protein n=1 Tax=Limibacter armeniacum TaxID=466084 RepID=UPI002FE51D5E